MSQRPLPSITRRLMVLLTLVTIGLWLFAVALTSGILQHELNEGLDRTLIETADRLLPLAVDAIRDHDVGREAREIRHLTAGEDHALIYQLRDRTGVVALRSHNAPDAPLNADLRSGFADVGGFRIFTAIDPQSGMAIEVAEPIPHRQRAVFASMLMLFLPLLLLVPLSAAGIWFAVRRGLRPLLALQAEISARDSGHLAPLPVTGLPAELAPIATALSHLIERVKAALDAERQFAANSAHELRTPIAAALAQTQRLIATAPDERTRAEGLKIESSLRRLVELSEKLMQLARADSGMAVSDVPAAVLPVVRLVIADSAARSRPARNIDLAVVPEAENWTARVNVDALGIVLRNLIDNAIVHSPAGTPVEVVLAGDRTIVVRNASAVIAADVLERLRHRFERGATVASGSGLGLAIVETILGQVGGELTLRSPAANSTSGFEAIVRLA
ncbi:MAG TPA: ATP-binding protein [Devosiaceae bacterium]|jgi:two-component system OmpR family sensor kinase|nr:ATP-binding protein [Devosiaceae bacterium]